MSDKFCQHSTVGTHGCVTIYTHLANVNLTVGTQGCVNIYTHLVNVNLTSKVTDFSDDPRCFKNKEKP